MNKIALILFTFLPVSASFGQQIRLVKGQKFSVDNNINAVTTQTLMGQAIESNASLTSKYVIEVKEIMDSTYHLTNTFTKINMKMSAMGNDLNFDSDKKEDMTGEYGAAFKDLINQPKEVAVTSRGKIVQSNKLTGPDSTQQDIMKMMIAQLIGDPEETGYGLNVAFVSTPGKVSAGFTWTDSSNSDGVHRATTYRVKEIKGNVAVISITGTLLTNTKSQMQGMDFENRSKGNLTGEETVDLTTGVIKQRTAILESIGSVSLAAQGLEIPVTTKITFVSSVKPG